MNKDRIESIKNGELKRYSGLKQVAFNSKTGQINPVLYAVYSGFANQQGTVQSVQEGDVVAVVSWKENGLMKDYYLYQVQDGLKFHVPVPQTALLWQLLHDNNPWLNAWLEPSSRELPVSIPLDIIPETMYLANQAKISHLAKVFDRFALDYDPKDFFESKKSDLKLVPRELDVDLQQMPASDLKTEWWGSPGTKKPPIQLDCVSKADGTYSVRGWRRFKHIIRICHDVHKSKRGSHGKTIDVWKGIPLNQKK